MKKDFLKNRIKEIIIEESLLDISQENIAEDTDLIRELGYDSIGIINMIIHLEKEFDISFTENLIDLTKLTNLKEINETITKIIEEKNGK